MELISADRVSEPWTPLAAASETYLALSPGVKTGLFMITLMIVILPVLAFIFGRFDLSIMSWPVAILVLLLGGGGLLRIAYEMMFGSQTSGELGGRQGSYELSAADLTTYVSHEPIPGRWKTDELELRPAGKDG
jgi:hypothetical protein